MSGKPKRELIRKKKRTPGGPHGTNDSTDGSMALTFCSRPPYEIYIIWVRELQEVRQANNINWHELANP